MTTPTRSSQMASTPKNPLTSTPGRSHASPRPNLGAFANKTIAGKSPAVKTPASLQSHAHRISVSSHPTSTPLAASTLPDDILNMSTPAAALMAMAPTGLTPVPPAHDGLGISAELEGAGVHDVHASKNPQRERYDRLKEIQRVLKTKARGRGVTRDNIQTLAKIHGFEPLWQDNNLTFAGEQYVELEMEFDEQQKDIVNKATLKFNEDPDADEGVVQDDASKVLTENLAVDWKRDAVWHDLGDFSDNLDYLSYIERIPGGNCFKVLDNLYDAFQKIWMEEKKRMKWRHDLHHLCQSNVGEPRKDMGRKLGLSTRYWVKGAEFIAKDDSKLEGDSDARRDWTATFTIEKGPPSLAAEQTWINESNILASSARAEDIFQEAAIDRPTWQEAESSGPNSVGANGDAMDVDQPGRTEKLDVHFVCHLDPSILLPLPVAQELNKNMRMVDITQRKIVSFQQSLASGDDFEPDRTWQKRQIVFSKMGEQSERTHSYTLYTIGHSWALLVSRLMFTHPKQYAESLPVLRQYAFVNTLLRSIVPSSEPSTETVQALRPSPPTKEHKPLANRRKVITRSNRPKAEENLDALLNPGKANGDTTLPIDVRLDTNSSSNKACKFEVRLPLSSSVLTPSSIERLKPRQFLVIQFDVLLNGIVEINNIEGVELAKEKKEEFKKKLGKVVRVSEDIGMTVSWLLRELDSGS